MQCAGGKRPPPRALFDEAVRQINPSRPTIDLTTDFYTETGKPSSMRAMSRLFGAACKKMQHNLQMLVFGQ
jgi:hypothetical protein